MSTLTHRRLLAATLVTGLAAAAVVASTPAPAQAAVLNVRNAQEFRDAIETANINGQANAISVDASFTWQGDAPDAYTGTQDIAILGNGNTITLADGVDCLLYVDSLGEADVLISSLDVTAPEPGTS